MNEIFEKLISSRFPDGITWQKKIATFHPETSQQASEIFGLALSHHQPIFISGFGNNIDPIGQSFFDKLVIKSDRLNNILKISAKDFFITVGAGYPLKEINKELQKQNLWFPFGDTIYPGSFGGALVIGLAADDGNHIVPISRNLLSITGVLPDGSVIKPGALTFKSVSGYDASRLFYNSWGTLGFLTQLSFRVLPLSKKEGFPDLRLCKPDRNMFIKELSEESETAEMYRSIKNKIDPDNLLPII